MQHSIVIRLLNGEPVWYPPGSSDTPRPLADPAARASLQAAVGEPRTSVCFAAPGTDVRLLELTVTPEEKKHIDKSLAFMLEDQLAADIDTLHFAHQLLDPGTQAVAVCTRERMEAWQASLGDLPGIRQWLPEPLLLPWRQGEWCLVLEEDSALLRTGRCEGCVVERSLLVPVLQAAAQDNAQPGAVIVYGSDQAADTELLPEALRSRVQWRRGGLGAARLLAQSDGAGLNLLQGPYALRLPIGRWWRHWRAVAALLTLAVGLQLLAAYMEYRQLQQKNLALRAAIETSYREAYPRGVLQDAEKQLRRQLDAMRGSAQSGGFMQLLDRAGAVIADRQGARIASINYNDKGGEMRLNIVASDYESVEQIRAAMDAAGLEAVMESSSAQGKRVRARLRVGERS